MALRGQEGEGGDGGKREKCCFSFCLSGKQL